MIWQVDPSGTAPLFEQVAACARRAMASGELRRGDRLPSAKHVAGLLEINLHTVLRAYQLLRDEELIELRRGRGAVVTAADDGGAALLRTLVGELVVQARRLGASPDDLTRLIESEYRP
ncbi:MAG: GntR family transcriptional regulator [Terracoccus sp.]